MLQPKRTKFRKAFKGRIHGDAKGGTALNFGSYGLKAMEPERITARQIEAARRARADASAPQALRQMTATELTERRAAESTHYDADPCACLACQAAAVTTLALSPFSVSADERPGSKPADMSKPVQVFLIMG